MKADAWTDNFSMCTNEHVNYDVADCWGCKEYLYMRRYLPCFERMVPLVRASSYLKNDAVNPGPSYSYLKNEAVTENEGESRPVVLGESRQ